MSFSLPFIPNGVRTGTAMRPKQGPSRRNSVGQNEYKVKKDKKGENEKGTAHQRRKHRSIEPQILQGRVERGEPWITNKVYGLDGVRAERKCVGGQRRRKKRSIAPPTANGPSTAGYLRESVLRTVFFTVCACTLPSLKENNSRGSRVDRDVVRVLLLEHKRTHKETQ